LRNAEDRDVGAKAATPKLRSSEGGLVQDLARFG
jgi:hypothetical protein